MLWYVAVVLFYFGIEFFVLQFFHLFSCLWIFGLFCGLTIMNKTAVNIEQYP
jgi:hypothetical protein